MSRPGFVVRLLYFLVAPFMVVAFAAVIPITGVLVVMLAFLIPLSVTIVSYQLAGRARNVRIMLGAAAVSIALAVLGMSQNAGTLNPASTVARARLRSEAAPERAVAVHTAALTSVWQDLRDGRHELIQGGWLADAALARTRAELTAFYRPAEANAFQVRVWPVDQPTHVLLQCHQPNDRPPVWLAMHADGTTSHDPAAIPAGYLDARPNHKSSASH